MKPPSAEPHPSSAYTPKGQRRKHALIVAAAELLLEGGFDAVRHRAVAERAEVPLAATTYYFSSIEDLIVAAVEYESHRELADGRARLNELDTPVRGYDVLIELVLDLLLGKGSRDGGAESVLLRYERLIGSPRRPYLSPVLRELGDQLQELLAEAFSRCGLAVSTRRRFELIALVDGAVVNALIESDPDPRRVARRMLREQLTGEVTEE